MKYRKKCNRMNDNKMNQLKTSDWLERFFSLFLMEAKELIRSKWILTYFLTFLFVSVAILFAGKTGGIYDFSGISKFIASLLNISFILVPIFSLGPSSISISGARENLTLEYMLSFPVEKRDIYFSKFFSVFFTSALAVSLSLFVAFVLFRFEGIDTKALLSLVFILLLSFVFISIGFLVSTVSKTKSGAIAISFFIWFIIIIGGELGTLGFISVSKIPTSMFFPIVFLNPAETFRVSVIAIFSDSLDILGPFGIYIYSRLGDILIPVSAAILFTYGLFISTLAYKIFSLQKVSVSIRR